MALTLKDVKVNTKTVEVPFPGLEGFSVTISAVSREMSRKIRKDSEDTKIDPKLRMPVTELNEEKFVKRFAQEAIKGWKGLKYKYLPELLLVDLSGVEDLEEELEYSLDDSIELLKHSQSFDNWINEEVFNIERFRD